MQIHHSSTGNVPFSILAAISSLPLVLMKMKSELHRDNIVLAAIIDESRRQYSPYSYRARVVLCINGNVQAFYQ